MTREEEVGAGSHVRDVQRGLTFNCYDVKGTTGRFNEEVHRIMALGALCRLGKKQLLEGGSFVQSTSPHRGVTG